MMHCTMEDLGALQAGEASSGHGGTSHLRYLSGGARRVVPANRAAQSAAGAATARDRWPAVRSALRAQRSRRRRTWGAWTGSLALAATIAAVLLMQPVTPSTAHAELSQVKRQSATLEDSLQRYDTDGRVLSGHAAAVVADLEDRISILDGALVQREQSAQDAELVQLWQERVGLMRELMNARATRARYVGL